jgi:hypothetical protein
MGRVLRRSILRSQKFAIGCRHMNEATN